MKVLNERECGRGFSDFRLDGRKDNFPYAMTMAYIVMFAFLIRLVTAASYLNSYDTEWNIMWAVQLGKDFFSAHMHVSSLDYPPLYLYPLYAVGRLVSVESIGGYPPFRMLAIKFIPCLTDSLTCVVLYRLASRRNRQIGQLAAMLWAINPAGIFNCACWGQTDCVLMFMASLLILALDEKRVIASGVLWAAMCSVKLQGLYLTPVIGMEVLTICFGRLSPKAFSFSDITKSSVKRFTGFLCAAAGTLAVIYLPFMLGSGFSAYHPEMSFTERFFKPLTVYSEGLAKYPYITLNADNIYMLLGKNGVNDELRFFPGVSVHTLGSLFLLLAMALVVAVYLFGRRHSPWLAAFMFMECVFMLTCRQHERYQILTLVLLMGAFVRHADRRLLTLFSLHSVVIFFNQFRVLSLVRENSGWWHYYRGTRTVNSELMQNVYRSGADWVDSTGVFSRVNALMNVCLFIASMVFVIRFFVDEDSGRPLSVCLRERLERQTEKSADSFE